MHGGERGRDVREDYADKRSSKKKLRREAGKSDSTRLGNELRNDDDDTFMFIIEPPSRSLRAFTRSGGWQEGR